ncbi:MAG: hypothetical protein M0Q24_07095 [Sulfurimonas sp.]|nr:hypothetical protein [Sulfurimonas sp.]MCK9491839.1 hypothetical protein [Sulfurimonas sp.]
MIERRKFLTLWALSASALAVSGCKDLQTPQIDKQTRVLPDRIKRKSIEL